MDPNLCIPISGSQMYCVPLTQICGGHGSNPRRRHHALYCSPPAAKVILGYAFRVGGKQALEGTCQSVIIVTSSAQRCRRLHSVQSHVAADEITHSQAHIPVVLCVSACYNRPAYKLYVVSSSARSKKIALYTSGVDLYRTLRDENGDDGDLWGKGVRLGGLGVSQLPQRGSGAEPQQQTIFVLLALK